MKNKEKLFLIKYKLSLLLFVIVVAISVILGTFQKVLYDNSQFGNSRLSNIIFIIVTLLAGAVLSLIFGLYFSNHFTFNEETTVRNDELEWLIVENNRSYLETVKSLANAIEAKDSYTRGHSDRVKEYSIGIANMLKLSRQEIYELEFGSILHDIGKIGVPEEVLNKNGRFTEEEYSVMKKHPLIGHDILRDVRFLEQSLNIISGHHERIDGNGYPCGLKGDEISLLARIVCVADAYDAMTSSRPYRLCPLSKYEAVEEMVRNKDSQFDGKIVDVFIEWLMENSGDEELAV